MKQALHLSNFFWFSWCPHCGRGQDAARSFIDSPLQRTACQGLSWEGWNDTTVWMKTFGGIRGLACESDWRFGMLIQPGMGTPQALAPGLGYWRQPKFTSTSEPPHLPGAFYTGMYLPLLLAPKEVLPSPLVRMACFGHYIWPQGRVPHSAVSTGSWPTWGHIVAWARCPIPPPSCSPVLCPTARETSSPVSRVRKGQTLIVSFASGIPQNETHDPPPTLALLQAWKGGASTYCKVVPLSTFSNQWQWLN